MACRTIDAILTDINTIIESGISYSPNVFYGLSVLQNRDGATFPLARISASEGEMISPLDTKAMKFYHRLTGMEVDEVPGKGVDNYSIITHTLRLVGVGYRPEVTSGIIWDNEDLANEVMNVLNATPRLTTGKESVSVVGRPITDKGQVLRIEYAGNDRIQTKILNLVAFAIDYEVKQRVVVSAAAIIPITAFSYSNNGQTVESSDFVAMVPSLTPSGATAKYYLDANDTLPSGLYLNEDTGYITRTGTIADGSYSFDIIAAGYGAYSGYATVTVTLTVAAVNPVLSNPTDTSTSSTTGSGTVDTDTGNGTLYWVVTQSATSPTGVQIKAGNNDGGTAADDSGSQAVSGTGTQNVSFTGLSSGTTYYAHYYQEDEETDGSNVSTADGFSTDSGATQGGAIDFVSANSDYVDTGVSLSASTGYEGLFLFKTPAGAGTRTICDNRDAFLDGVLVYINSSNLLELYHNSTKISVPGTYDDNNWHYAHVKWDGSDITLTTFDSNGTQEEQVTTSEATSISVTTPSYIGSRNSSAANFFNGQIALAVVRTNNSTFDLTDWIADPQLALTESTTLGDFLFSYTFDDATYEDLDTVTDRSLNNDGQFLTSAAGAYDAKILVTEGPLTE
jgi:hypothetical protein